ncbi:uncharacterized protein IUM83_07333 [Phytophthora cinnamomi]|uniref:uncharacterized protein n=1 Tax=Phytophthora cinnamomi TaxID=4785 RepID=UPI003559DF8B|nr:hypothetical protein IUM83_07333 [Phytophthora cinnamomi]
MLVTRADAAAGDGGAEPPGAVRAAGAVAPGVCCLEESRWPLLQRRCEPPRPFSSDARARDGQRKTLAVEDAAAWQAAVKPSLLTFLQLKKHLMWREGGHRIDPTQKKELDGMPFAWDRTQYKWDHFLLPALRRFYDLNGHTDSGISAPDTTS